MGQRRDPVRGAARVLDRLFVIVREYDEEARLAVGEIRTHPGSRNTVPGHVDFTVDLRHPVDSALADLDAELRALVVEVSAEMDVEGRVEQIWHSPTVHFEAECIDAVRAAATRLGYDHTDVFSGAGHDDEQGDSGAIEGVRGPPMIARAWNPFKWKTRAGAQSRRPA